MKITPTNILNCYVIELEKKEDNRGFLARTFDKGEFNKLGINLDLAQGYVSFSKQKGTMRGVHYQVEPFAEYKLTRVTSGAIFEAVIDLRKNSPTYLKKEEFVFRSSEYIMLLTPPNCAHAILTLEDNTEFINFSDKPFTPEFERGVKFDDPFFDINWPIPVELVSQKDLSWDKFKE
jgi:dTDP-4-dehydrorhamnose 3,5-epimerase